MYFGYASDKKKCLVKHDIWKEEVRYVVTIAVPENSSHEASALEEYLINNLLIKYNMIGKR